MKIWCLNLGAAISVMAVQSAAFACPHSQQQFICPQDQVVDQYGNTGTVAGINVQSREAAVNEGGNSDSVVSIDSLALAQGCVGSVCVGDRAVDANGNIGSIAAVNPYNYTAALNEGGNSDAIISLDSLALGVGCLDYDCVGDNVVDPNGNAGTIVGINYSKRQLALDEGGNSAAIVSIESTALGHGCAAGNCVGDAGVDPNGNQGSIAAVNPYSGQIALSEGGNSDAMISPSQFMSSEYCATYGDADRTAPKSFILTATEIKIQIFTVQNAGTAWHFASQRQ
jgi:hypothetical protein